MLANRIPFSETAYASAEAAWLDKNENPYDIAPAFKEELRQRLPELAFNRYPDPESRRLRGALADYTGFPSEGIIVGNGGDEILQILFTAFTRPHSTVLTLEPCFSQYSALSEIHGVNRKCVFLEPCEREILVPEEKLLDALSAKPPSMILLDRPNNPTGMVLGFETVEKIIELSAGIVVVDEAYAEFSGKTILDDFKDREFPRNLVVLRTFSKAWGLAGLRIGYAICAPETARTLHSVKPPFNVNVFSQEAAFLALKYRKWMERLVSSISYTRDRFIEDVNRIPGWVAYPSEGNFVLLRGNQETGSVLKAAALQGLNLKDPGPIFSNTEAKECWIRVTIGREEDMSKLLSLLRSLS